MDINTLPTVNAALNATSAALLLAGYVFIRQRKIAAHKACMLAAFATSIAFLACYVTYHVMKQKLTAAAHSTFAGPDSVRPIYRAILFSHVVLAVAIVPLALCTLYLAFRERFDKHRRIARWTLPIWLYVSVTGVIVYLMLYHLFPAPAQG